MREAVPSVRVDAVIKPLIDTDKALVNEPPLRETVPSVTVVELNNFSGESVPCWSDVVPSVIVTAIKRPLKVPAFALVRDPLARVAVPSVMIPPSTVPLVDRGPALTMVPAIIEPTVDRFPAFNTAVPSVIVTPLTVPLATLVTADI